MAGKSMRAQAFEAIRQEIGEETCAVLSAIEHASPEELVPMITELRSTTHQLRAALAALLVMAQRETHTCPNCEYTLPNHNHLCVVRRLYTSMNGH